MTGEKRAHAGALPADADEGVQVRHRIGAAAAVGRIDVDTEEIVLAGQWQDAVVETVLHVTEFFGGADLFAEGPDVGREFFGNKLRHGKLRAAMVWTIEL